MQRWWIDHPSNRGSPLITAEVICSSQEFHQAARSEAECWHHDKDAAAACQLAELT